MCVFQQENYTKLLLNAADTDGFHWMHGLDLLPRAAVALSDHAEIE